MGPRIPIDDPAVRYAQQQKIAARVSVFVTQSGDMTRMTGIGASNVRDLDIDFGPAAERYKIGFRQPGK